MQKVVFMRHSESDYSFVRERKYIGHGLDLAQLTENGIQIAENASLDSRLDGAEIIVSSPYTRALQTAAIVSKNRQLNIKVELDLHEWMPDLSFKYFSKEEASAMAKLCNEHRGICPEDSEMKFENLENVFNRAKNALLRYGEYKKIIVVTHEQDVTDIQKYLMALDQGTTGSRCIIFDKSNTVISSAHKELTQIYPKAGWVEHDPVEIWSTQLAVAAEAMTKAGLRHSDIAAVGITNQRETTIVWDKHTGRPVYNAIVWQCRRTSEYCDILKNSGFSEVIRKKTGLVTDAYFSGTKLKWILENVSGAAEEAEKGNLLFGKVDSWLLWNLTKGRVHATDYTNASRTMMFNIHTLEWDEDILKQMNIPKSMLPEVKPSSYVYGCTAPDIFGGAVFIGGVAGDQQAALFGQCCFDKGTVKNTYGTGCFILMNTGSQAITSKNGLLTTIACGLNGKTAYALEGSVFSAGATVQWLRDGLGLINNSSESEAYALKTDNCNGVYFVPAFTGMGAPYWNQDARGAVLGITRGVRKEHIIRAALESAAYQSYDVIKAMETDAGILLREIKADGGASSNNFLMQFQADILNATVTRPAVIESTSLGAAYLAGLAIGFYNDESEIIKNSRCDRQFLPKMTDDTRSSLLNGWHNAVEKTLS
ncbi:sugar kinase [Holotrichia oblita]|nr:sugar kinase [Holotrichia oblita]